MSANAIVRRFAQGIVVLCAVGGTLAAVGHDLQDAALIWLVGVWALVTARKMAWKLRLARDGETTYSALPDLASS
jgi:uncharacterized membrane protein YfcA